MNTDDPEAPTEASGSSETMRDLGFGEEYDDGLPFAEWEEHLAFQEERNNGFEDFYQQDAGFHGMFFKTISKIHKHYLLYQ
jgi:hypothetical protein